MEDVLPEIQRAVEAKLARYGAVGKVVIDGLGQTISLLGNGPPVTLPVGALALRWKEIAFEERERECTHLARSLVRERRPVAPAKVRRQVPYFAFAVCGGLLLAGAVGYRKLRLVLEERAGAAANEATPPQEDPDAERRAHAAQVCNATRARLAQGGTVGPADTEGWVVELALLKPASEPEWPSLSPFLTLGEGASSGRVAWSGAPELSQLQGYGTLVEVHDSVLPEQAPQYRQRTLTFSGAYVLPYFREREQIQLIRLAHALAESHGVNLAGLYARCAERSEHHMGSWFVGTSPGAAAAAVLLFMGAYAQPPLLPHEVLSSRADRDLELEFALGNLLGTTQRLKKADLVSTVGPQDGTVAGTTGFITIAFPFVESDRALVASRSLARLFEPGASPSAPSSTRRRGAH
ncbi:MAG TPA: hypothetical protein VFS67_18390 [Polyangiaceae bacterium]|nr:hypothetical protein [Polyangiaceae bacterium]